MAEQCIPFHRASIGQDEIDAVTQVLQSRWLTTGPKAHQFEADFSAFVGAHYAIAVNSCRAALQLAVDAIEIAPGDEVLVPTYTFAATAAVVVQAGAIPILCDSSRNGFNVDLPSIEGRIISRARAIISVHIAGEPCDLDGIHSVAKQHGLHVIEDAAHALPDYRGRKIGGLSELTAFSFYATKTLTTGEGGMLTTNNEAYARRAARMRLHGMSGDAWKRYAKEGSWYYEVTDAGYKLNLCDILAAIGLVQLKKCHAFRQKRRTIGEEYLRRFSMVSELDLPPTGNSDSTHAWHLFILRLNTSSLSITREEFMEQLKARGVGTSVHFIPLHLHPFYQQRFGYKTGDFPYAEDAFSRCISLPIFPDMTESEGERVVEIVIETAKVNRKKTFALAI